MLRDMSASVLSSVDSLYRVCVCVCMCEESEDLALTGGF